MTDTGVPGLAAREAASAVLDAVLTDRRPLDAMLGAEDGHPDYRALPDRDRPLARAIVAAALRRYGQITDALGRLIDRPLPPRSWPTRRILETAAAQLLFLDVPDHAVVSLAVEMAERSPKARHFKPLVNAVLRRLAADRNAILAAQDAPLLNTPNWLWNRWLAHYGAETTRAIAEAHQTEPALDLMLGTPFPPPERGRSGSEPAGVGVPEHGELAKRLGGTFLPNGTLRIVAKGPIDALPGFHEGAWWVQDAASSLPARLLGDVAGTSVADLCAAPGGKTAQLCQAGAHVTAIDRSEARLARLKSNLDRLGFEAETIAADVTAWEPGRTFDAILLDAPCSGTGTIRRHPDIARLKSEDDIRSLAAIQHRLIAKAASFLRPGGTLVFSTCSLESEEGEDQASRALAALPLVSVPIHPGETGGLGEPVGSTGALRTLPSQLRHDDPLLSGLAGFYIARFRRL